MNLTSREDVRQRLIHIVSDHGDLAPGRIKDAESLHRYGIDSLACVNIAYEIGLLIGRDVPSTLLTDHDTIDKLVDYTVRSAA